MCVYRIHIFILRNVYCKVCIANREFKNIKNICKRNNHITIYVQCSFQIWNMEIIPKKKNVKKTRNKTTCFQPFSTIKKFSIQFLLLVCYVECRYRLAFLISPRIRMYSPFDHLGIWYICILF